MDQLVPLDGLLAECRREAALGVEAVLEVGALAVELGVDGGEVPLVVGGAGRGGLGGETVGQGEGRGQGLGHGMGSRGDGVGARAVGRRGRTSSALVGALPQDPLCRIR